MPSLDLFSHLRECRCDILGHRTFKTWKHKCGSASVAYRGEGAPSKGCHSKEYHSKGCHSKGMGIAEGNLQEQKDSQWLNSERIQGRG